MKRKTKLFILLTVIILLIVITFLILSKVFIGYSNNHTGDRNGEVDTFVIDDGSGGDTPKPDKPSGHKGFFQTVVDIIKDLFTGEDEEEPEPINDDPEPLNVVIEPVVDSTGIEGDLLEVDPDKIWDSTNTINVFKNAKFGNRNLIAPGSYGAYHFQVQNKTSFPIVYNLSFLEDNSIHVNLMYRMRKNDEWIVKKWTKLPDIFFESYRVESSEVDDYVLEWKWFEAPNDTELGLTSSELSPLTYQMQLRISGYGDYEEVEDTNTENTEDTNVEDENTESGNGEG